MLEATGLEAVKEGALQGIGAAFLSGLAVKRELESGLLVVIPIEGVQLKRHLTPAAPGTEFVFAGDEGVFWSLCKMVKRRL